MGIRCTLLQGPRKMCLRIRYSSKEESDNDGDSTNTPMKKSGSSQGGGLPDELISLASLFLRRRLKLDPIVREDDRPLYFPNRRRGGHWIDEPLVNGESKLNELTRWFKLVENLNIKYYLKFILSARLYHRALLLIEEEPDLAYLNLVSAIEVLCNETKIEGAKIDDLDQDLKPLIESIEDKTLGGKIAETILRRSFMKRKFVKFILDNIEEDFWSPKDRPEIF